MRMNFDKLDALIIYYIWVSNFPLTTSDIAKFIFECKTKKDLQDKTSYIVKRLRKLQRYGVIKCKNIKVSNRNKKIFILNLDKCFMGIKLNNSMVWVSLGEL